MKTISATWKNGQILPDEPVIQQIDISLGNCTVVSTDKDLNAVRGLTVENWAE